MIFRFLLESSKNKIIQNTQNRIATYFEPKVRGLLQVRILLQKLLDQKF